MERLEEKRQFCLKQVSTIENYLEANPEIDSKLRDTLKCTMGAWDCLASSHGDGIHADTGGESARRYGEKMLAEMEKKLTVIMADKKDDH